MSLIGQFVELSRYAGMREDLIQAGGGNTSVKLSKNKMLIKASGFQLADIKESFGYAMVDPSVIVDFFENNPIDQIEQNMEKSVLDRAYIEGQKPSIETFLHSITDDFTLHTHPTLVNVLASRIDGMEILKELFPNALFVDYDTPGIKLSTLFFKEYKKMKPDYQAELVFLKNHGLLVSGKSAKEVIDKCEKTLCIIEKYLGIDMNKHHNLTELHSLLGSTGCIDQYDIMILSNDENVKLAHKNFGDSLWKHQFCPDAIVYCGRAFLVLEDNDEAKQALEFKRLYGKPIIIVYRNHIYIVAESVKKAREIESVLSFTSQVALYNKGFMMDLLSDQEQQFLTNWDAEKYRKSMK